MCEEVEVLKQIRDELSELNNQFADVKGVLAVLGAHLTGRPLEEFDRMLKIEPDIARRDD
jgi:hypothetical protein